MAGSTMPPFPLDGGPRNTSCPTAHGATALVVELGSAGAASGWSRREAGGGKT